MRKFVVLLFISLSIPALAEDRLVIPTGAKLFIESKSQSDEAALFKDVLERKLVKDESDKRYSKPGFPIVEKREEADYVLRLMVAMRGNATSLAAGNVSLLTPDGKETWFYEFDCTTAGWVSDPIHHCVDRISDELKNNQVNSEGKRAGMLGWKIKKKK